MNPLDYKGEQFLAFYMISCAVILVAALCLRWFLRGPGRVAVPSQADDLDPYEIAAIAGGERGAIRAAIVSLFQRGVVIAGVTSKKTGPRDSFTSQGASAGNDGLAGGAVRR